MPTLKGFTFKNQTETSADLYFYGDIVSDWWGAWQDEDQYPDAIKNFLSEQEGISGGSLPANARIEAIEPARPST